MSNGGFVGAQSSFLYRNNGNANAWLKLKLVGSVANRSAIGAKVRVRTVISGASRWQMREITAGDFGMNSLIAHFGLGDATNADLVRIEWPSGAVQELHDVAPRQLLTLTEPPRLNAVLDKAEIAGTSAKFLKVLTTNRRLFAVTDVIRAFRALVAKYKGEATADVTVAEALNDKNLDALKTALKSVTGKDVALNVKIDPSIIGGLVVKLGSRMVDSSLRTKLNSIKHAMKEAG